MASATRLHFPEASATLAQVDVFGKSLVALVDRERPDQSLLLRKHPNRISHAGGERIKPGTPQEAFEHLDMRVYALYTGNCIQRTSVVT